MNRKWANIQMCVALAILASLVVFLAACAANSAPVATAPAVTAPATTAPATLEAEAPIQVKVGVLPFLSYAVLEIADAEGYFAEQGLDVELVQSKSSSEVIPLLLDGQIDVAPAALTAGLFNAIARGGELKMALPSTTFTEQDCAYNAYFVRKSDLEAGTYQEPANWKGAKVTLSVSGAQSIFGYITERFLQQGGLSLADVEVPVIELAAQPEALRAGQVDIVLASEPTITRMAADGDFAMLLPVEPIVPDLTMSAVVYGARLLDNPDVGKRFAVAYLKAVRQYQQGATPRNVEIIAGLTGLEPALVSQLCLVAIPADGQFNVNSIMDYQAWLVTQGLLDGTVAPAAFLDTRFAEEANRILEGAK